MKSKTLAVALPLVCLILLFTACGNPVVERIMGKGPAKETPGETGTFYTVTFDSKGGSPAKTTASVPENGTVARPANPTRANFGFVNWYENEGYEGDAYNFDTPVTEDFTLYAKWNSNFFTVTFNSNQGSEVPSQDVGAGGMASKPTPDPTKSDCALDGWWLMEGDSFTYEWNFNTDSVTGNITLYAKWVPVYTVAFMSNGEAYGEIQTVREGGTATQPATNPGKPAPIHQLYEGTRQDTSGYIFDGWYNDNDKWNFNNPVTGNITLHAEWTAPFIDLSSVTGSYNNDVERAIAYVNANAAAGPYTLLVGGNENVGAQQINTANFDLTLQGLDEERTIQLSDTADTLFSIGSNASLTLGSNITLKGRTNGTNNLVSVSGTFTMEDGSKITGHRASSGTVSVTTGNFIMNGGEISGNTTTPTGNCGGVFVNFGTFTVGGSAVISGNTSSPGTPSNVFLNNENFIILGDGTSTTGYVPAPASNMEIWVQTATLSDVIVENGATAAIAGYFHADDEGKDVLLSDGRLVISDFYGQVAAYGGAPDNVTINVPYNLTLPRNVTVPTPGTTGITLTIKSLSGSNILTRGAADSDASKGLFMVSDGARLVFEDIKIDGNKDAHTNNAASLVRVNSGGTFTLKSGALLKDNRATNGGGVYVTGTGSKFTMESGEVSGNVATSGGGGVYMNGGTFNLSGGEISENTANGSTGGGGGVYVGSGVFNFTSGTVSDNVATSGGGGVYMNGGEFNMSNPSSTTETRISDNSAKRGGGVNVNNATFIMSGGTIGGAGRGNSATENGGGVYVLTNGTFNMEGGAVSGNKVTGSGGTGGGVYVYGGGKFNMLNSACLVIENAATGSGGGVYVGNTNSEFNMSAGSIVDNTAIRGGGVYAYFGGTFSMTGGEVLGNTATGAATFGGGGGVYLDQATFRISDGTVYGTDAIQNLQNKATSGTGAALGMGEIGTAQHGTFNGGSWNSNDSLTTTNNTIKVANGELVSFP